MDYFDLDRIIECEERIKVSFNCNINHFGVFVCQNTKSIKLNQPVDLPFFLVEFLIKNEHCEIIETGLKEIKNDLYACSSIVNLENKHFYFINLQYYDLNYLSSLFYERLGEFVKLINKEDFSEEDVGNMSACEKKYFINSRKCFKKFQDFYLTKLED